MAFSAISADESLVRCGRYIERNAVRAKMVGLAWEWPDSSVLRLSFALPPGSYATAVLHELGEVGEASRVVSDRLSEDR